MATVTVMITSFDDYPIHQTWQPVAHPESGDPSHYDRYFFNGYSRDGSIFFALAMGLYPNRHVMDTSFSVIKNGEQINIDLYDMPENKQIEIMGVNTIEQLTALEKQLRASTSSSIQNNIMLYA